MGNYTTFTAEEVSRHNTKESYWIIINNKVYDVTNLKHPAQFDVFATFGGKECTSDFYLMHNKSSAAHKLKKDFFIGYIRNK